MSSPKIIEKRTFTDSRGYFQEVAKEGNVDPMESKKRIYKKKKNKGEEEV